jgi:hypothetical protein
MTASNKPPDSERHISEFTEPTLAALYLRRAVSRRQILSTDVPMRYVIHDGVIQATSVRIRPKTVRIWSRSFASRSVEYRGKLSGWLPLVSASA